LLILLFLRSDLNAQTLSPLQQVSGYLRLRFTCDQEHQLTSLSACEQTPPLRVVHAFPLPHGATLLHLHNLSGGVLGGDQFTLEIEVGPAARVQLTTTGATRLYRSRPGVPPARQQCHVRIQAGGLLEYLPDQLIPFAGSRYQQSTYIELAEDAGLFWWETIAPGRLARGESFAYDLLQLAMEVTVSGRPIACERFRLEPQHADLSSPVRLGCYLYHSSFFICRTGLPSARWIELEQELTELALRLTQPGKIVWGVSALVTHGLLVRAASRRGYDIAPGLQAFWQTAKRALYGEEAIPPRKIY
jgi:urease accessory protein